MKKMKTLKLNYEFRNVLSRGKYYSGNQIFTYIYKNKFNYNRLGIAINTKLCHAVKRNRIKRVIRAAYQQIQDSNFHGYDIVFIWNKNAKVEDLNYNIILNDMKKAFSKAQIVGQK